MTIILEDTLKSLSPEMISILVKDGELKETENKVKYLKIVG